MPSLHRVSAVAAVVALAAAAVLCDEGVHVGEASGSLLSVPPLCSPRGALWLRAVLVVAAAVAGFRMLTRCLGGEGASIAGLRPCRRSQVQLAAAARSPRRFGEAGEVQRDETAKLDVRGWHFASADEAHDVTHAQHAEALRERLSGPSTGRQIWWNESDHPAVAPGETERRTPRRRYLAFDVRANPNSADLPFRIGAQRAAAAKRSRRGAGLGEQARDGALRAASYYASLQCEDGHWAGDYGGPLFLLPGLVVSAYITGALDVVFGVSGSAKRCAAVLYLRHHQQADGGWGTHIESPSTMFGTVVNYVALRLLGVAPDAGAPSRRDATTAPHMALARTFIDEHGGALYTSSWAKLWLAVLGVYAWEGLAPIPPEFWLLPAWFPMHPSRFWCHCRMVYLPMSYLYGTRFVYPDADRDALIAAIRAELYGSMPYADIDWAAHRSSVAVIDDYSPVSPAMRALQCVLSFYEKWAAVVAWSRACPCLSARARGSAFALRYMAAEDECTNYICIGPVNKAMNMLCAWAGANAGEGGGAGATVSAGGEGGSASGPSRGVWTPAFKKHLLRCDDYLWLAEDGLKMQGYNGSQTWDTTFAVQAMVAALHGAENRPGGLDAADAAPVVACVERARRFTLRSQIAGTTQWECEPLRSQWFRCVSRGGWPFSTAAHGWPISDCTAEGVKALLASARVVSGRGQVEDDGASDSFDSSSERLNTAVSVLLALHNRGEGGWATYEKTRGWGWFEKFNPSEVFGDIMIDYCYVECTSASITALARVLAQRDPRTERVAEMRAAIRRGKRFILSAQRADGSWYGSWGCCFSYAAWFAIEGLVCEGGGSGDLDYTESNAIAAALSNGVRFLLAKQRSEDGGWGEGFGSCHSKEYDDAPSTSVATSWALLALLASKRVRRSARVREAVERGVAFLLAQMERSGDFPQPRNISGVFNRSCGISYTAYRNVFPIWALAEYANESDAHSALRSSAEAADAPEEERVVAAADAAARAGAPCASVLDAPASGGLRVSRAGIVAALALGAALLLLIRAGVAAGTLEHPLGLLCGIGCVGVVQVVFTLPYYWWLMNLSSQPLIQRNHAARGRKQGAMYAFYGLSRHLAQPEGFLLIGGYLSVTWLLRMLPASYYVVEAPTLDTTRCINVLVQLLVIDLFQWAAHRFEHIIKPLYTGAHQPHHKWRSPSLFEAFEGSTTDTVVMIIVPLFATAWTIATLSAHVLHPRFGVAVEPTAWDYMIFGTVYANFLCLIHSPRVHPWEDTRGVVGKAVRALGIGTAADHHVHHATYQSNFGHLFTYWDRIAGRYTSPSDVKSFTMYDYR